MITSPGHTQLETLVVAERGSVNPAEKCALQIPFTALEKKRDVPESKQGFTLMSPIIIQ